MEHPAPESTVRDIVKRTSNLVAKARAGTPVLGVLSSMASPEAMESMGACGAEFVVIDTVHNGISGERLAHLLRAADLWDLVTIVRINDAAGNLARTALDLGACGVWIPNVETGDQLRKVIDQTLFPPYGNRGCCPLPRANRAGTADLRYLLRASEHPLIIPEIYSATAVENLDELLSFPECELFGSAPYNMALTTGLDFYDPDGFKEAMKIHRGIAAKVHGAGKLFMGALYGWQWNRETEKTAADLHTWIGTDFVLITEVGALKSGMRQAKSAHEKIVAARAAARKKPAPAQVEAPSAPPSPSAGRTPH